MILKNFNKFLSLFIILFFTSQVHGDEKIDIWKSQNLKKDINPEEPIDNSSTKTDKGLSSLNKIKKNQKIQITDRPIESMAFRRLPATERKYAYTSSAYVNTSKIMVPDYADKGLILFDKTINCVNKAY